VDLANF